MRVSSKPQTLCWEWWQGWPERGRWPWWWHRISTIEEYRVRRRSDSDDGGNFTQPGRRKPPQVLRSVTRPETGKLCNKWNAEVQVCINPKLAPPWWGGRRQEGFGWRWIEIAAMSERHGGVSRLWAYTSEQQEFLDRRVDFGFWTDRNCD